jgi:glycosidase
MIDGTSTSTSATPAKVVFLCFSTCLVIWLCAATAARAADFKREVIYQIVTDRFYDGQTANNNPPQSAGLYDATRTNWRAYWGGDFAGIQQKISYLAGMGITAIWISPPVDNLNVNIAGGGGPPTAAYHGYHARDFKQTEEHFGDINNTWLDFDNLVKAAHESGMKVIIDFAPNHTNPKNSGEFGALYDEGVLLGNYPQDPDGYFNHSPEIRDFNNRRETQYYSLYDLADLNQENPRIDGYLKDAAGLFQQHGVDGFRIDGVKHLPPGWTASLANSINTGGDSFLFGEWYLENVFDPLSWEYALDNSIYPGEGVTSLPGWSQGAISDPLYPDSYKLANKSGISLLDFPLNTAVREVFGPTDADFSEIASVMAQEASDFTWKEDLVTFLDGQDLPRFLSLQNERNRLHQALSFLLTSPGVPCIFYGTEQYLHNETNGGVDPYNRPMMDNFSTDTIAYSLIGKLSSLRRHNPALAYGSMEQRWLDSDVYIYERKSFGNILLVAINKNNAASYHIGALNTSLPPGTYSDYLAGQLGGLPLTVNSGAEANHPASEFVLSPGSVSIWSYTEAATGPEVWSVGPTVGQPGMQAAIDGDNFGAAQGTLLVGATGAAVTSWSDERITFKIPSVTQGNYEVKVVNSSGQVSNSKPLRVLAAKLIPVTFIVRHAPQVNAGEHIFLTGNTVELGDWDATWEDALGPLLAQDEATNFICAAVPAGRTLSFKFVKLTASGSASWEAGAPHTYVVPQSGTARLEVNWQY